MEEQSELTLEEVFKPLISLKDDKVEIEIPDEHKRHYYSLITLAVKLYPGKIKVINGSFLLLPIEEQNISQCVFKGHVDVDEGSFDEILLFTNCIFEKPFICSNAKFKKKLQFHACTFKRGMIAENTSFEGLVDFYRSTFSSRQQFHLTDFLKVAIFSKVRFEAPIQFLYNKVDANSFVSFESTYFEESIDISRANFNCRTRFWNASISNKVKDFSLYSSDDLLSLEVDKKQALSRLRESMRRVKEEFLKENNSIEAVKYRKEEKNLYWRELITRRSIYDFGDFLILFFSKISNNHGTNWIQGVLFTLILTYFGYSIYLSEIEIPLIPMVKNQAIWLQGYFDLFNVSKWDYDPFELGQNKPELQSLWLFIMRIIVAYGAYQTIVAFRKFSKN